MKYLDPNSLFQTIDNVSEALFFDFEIGDHDKKEVVNFILSQQEKPQTYADTFAPTEYDLQHDLVLFTGEKIKTQAGRRHMIGEEACRIIRVIGMSNDQVNKALDRADQGLLSKISACKQDPGYISGTYCCKACSCSLWLNIGSGGLKNDVSMLESGLRYLKTNRDGHGNWKGFPPNYLLYVLNGINIDSALNELKYAGKAIERKLKRKGVAESKYELRRTHLYEQILNKINRN